MPQLTYGLKSDFTDWERQILKMQIKLKKKTASISHFTCHEHIRIEELITDSRFAAPQNHFRYLL